MFSRLALASGASTSSVPFVARQQTKITMTVKIPNMIPTFLQPWIVDIPAFSEMETIIGGAAEAIITAAYIK